MNHDYPIPAGKRQLAKKRKLQEAGTLLVDAVKSRIVEIKREIETQEKVVAMAELKAFTGGGQSVKSASGELCERIKALVYEYSGVLPVSAAIGVIEIAKLEIIREQQ